MKMSYVSKNKTAIEFKEEFNLTNRVQAIQLNNCNRSKYKILLHVIIKLKNIVSDKRKY